MSKKKKIKNLEKAILQLEKHVKRLEEVSFDVPENLKIKRKHLLWKSFIVEEHDSF